MTPTDAKSYIEKVAKNCSELISAAKSNFEKEYYSVSAFLSITAIEEISKMQYVEIFFFPEDKFPPRPKDIGIKEIERLFRARPSRSHARRQQSGIFGSLFVNARADRTLGSATIRKYFDMAENGKLFDLRNRCLYVDVVANCLSAPSEIISRNDALELVCVAMEVVAERIDYGASFLGDEEYRKHFDKWQAFLRDADEFEKKHNFRPKKEIGKIANYLSRIGVAIVDLTDNLNLDDEVSIEGKKTSFIQKVTSIEINHKKVKLAEAGSMIGMKVVKPVRRNDLVCKIMKN